MGKSLHSQIMGIKDKKKGYKKTGELELFKKIAFDRSVMCHGCEGVIAKHLDTYGLECKKFIPLHFLTPTNFSHIKNKGMNKDLRLDPDNIEIVSLAYHFYEHNKQVMQTYYPN